MSLRSPGRPARLSRELIVATALELGLDELSMHQLAAELGVAHSALYRWVDNREHLLRLTADAIVERIMPAADPVEGDWRTWLADLGWSMRRELLRVPGFAARVVSPHEHTPAYDRLVARVADVLVTHAGVTRELAVQCWYVFGTSVVGWLAVEQNRSEPLDPEPRFDLLLETLLKGLPPIND